MTVKLVKFVLWSLVALGTAWGLPLPAPEMDLLDPAHFPDGDDPRSAVDRVTLLKYLCARAALWILFVLFFGGLFDSGVPPTEAAGLFFLVCGGGSTLYGRPLSPLKLIPKRTSLVLGFQIGTGLKWVLVGAILGFSLGRQAVQACLFDRHRRYPRRTALFSGCGPFFPGEPGEFFNLTSLVGSWPWGSVVVVAAATFLLWTPRGHPFVDFRWGPLVIFLVVVALTGEASLLRVLLLGVGYGYLFVGTHLRDFLTRRSGVQPPPRSSLFDFTWYPLYLVAPFFFLVEFGVLTFSGGLFRHASTFWYCALLGYAVHYVVPHLLQGVVRGRQLWLLMGLTRPPLGTPFPVEPLPAMMPKVVKTLEGIDRHSNSIKLVGGGVVATGAAGAYLIEVGERKKDRDLACLKERNAHELALRKQDNDHELGILKESNIRDRLTYKQNQLNFEIYKVNHPPSLWDRVYGSRVQFDPSKPPSVPPRSPPLDKGDLHSVIEGWETFSPLLVLVQLAFSSWFWVGLLVFLAVVFFWHRRR